MLKKLLRMSMITEKQEEQNTLIKGQKKLEDQNKCNAI